MPVFRCSRCNCVENTAVSHYATRPKGSPALCSECDPEIGKWHGRFLKMSADQFVEDDNGFLITHEEAAQKELSAEAATSAKKIQHIGVEGLAKHYYVMGWNHGVRWHEQHPQGKKE